MKRASCLITVLVVFATGQIIVGARSSCAVTSLAQQEETQITGVRLKGKKLWVIGENFSEGATIMVNGQAVATTNDPDNPGGILFAKKGGKKIPAESTVAISVQSSAGTNSQAFDFFSGVTITIDDGGKIINLRVGEKFQVLLKKESFEWSVVEFDPNIIIKLTNEPAPQGSQGIFQAVKAGRTPLSAVGELPCQKLPHPCLAPSLHFEVTLDIQ